MSEQKPANKFVDQLIDLIESKKDILKAGEIIGSLEIVKLLCFKDILIKGSTSQDIDVPEPEYREDDQ